MKKISIKDGFTIIEVVLVLAIIGLILASIFIGLPALQRAQRDAQRRNDAARFFSAALEYIEKNGEAPFKIEFDGVYPNRNYKPSSLGDTLVLDFVPRYVDNSCHVIDKNEADNLYGKIGTYGDRAYYFGIEGDECNDFRDPNGEIYMLTVLDGDGDGFKPGEDKRTNHNHLYATAGSKCTNNESVRAHTSSDRKDKSTIRYNDIAVWVMLENGSTYCMDNQTQGRK